MDELIRQLDKLYSPGKGFKVYSTIIPGILADFNKMLKDSPVGREVTEEYHLEDGKGVIIVSGTRSANGQVSINVRLKE